MVAWTKATVRVGLTVLLIGMSSAHAQSPTTGFLDRAVTVGSETYRYQVYLPLDSVSDRTRPIVMWLHPCCPNGTDGMRQTVAGLALAIRQNRERFPIIAVFPQARPGHRWDDSMTAQAMAALQAATREFHGDEDRTYLMGFSMGGRGVWSLAARQPERFAAAVVIAGPVAWIPDSWTDAERETALRENEFLHSQDPFQSLASKLMRLPIWLFHGSADSAAPPDDSRRMWRALQGVNSNARFTEYEGLGHDDMRALTESELWTWLLSKRRRAKRP